MSWSDIQGTKLVINLRYVQPDASPPQSSHVLLPALVPIVLPNQPSQNLQNLQNLLSTPLDQLFNQQWAQPQLQGTAQAAVQQAIQGAESGAYNVSVSFPQQGTLRAQTGALPLGGSGTQLRLGYFVPGTTASFKVSTGDLNPFPDPSYTLTFDAELEIEVDVFTDPRVPLWIRATFNATDLKLDGDGWATFYQFVGVIATLLTGSPLPLVLQAFTPASPDLSDRTTPAQVPDLLANVSTVFASVADAGFTELGVLVTSTPPYPAPSGNTVEIDLIHPADPGPQVSNALSPSGPTFASPQIGLSAKVVPAGGQDQVTGAYFPAAQSNRLAINWTNTTSGRLDHSEVQWGATSAHGVPPPAAQIHDETTQVHTFTATGPDVMPGTWYAFRVREFDAEGQAATGWSVPAVPPPPDPQPWDGIWTFLQTQATDQVELVLSDVIGTATLQNDGTFVASVIIPATVPPGTYELSAILSGQVMAQTPITIIAKDQIPPPLLQVFDPRTGITYQNAAIVSGGNAVYLRGQGFTPGIVHLWVDRSGGTSLGTATAGQNGAFTTQPLWPWSVTGAHNILAEDGSQQATAPVYAQYPAE